MSEPIDARTIVVLADCHIHPAAGIDWPEPALEAFAGADLFITLGDMGERQGLDALARIAPVIGVSGMDDEPDPRAADKVRLFDVGGVGIGCVFDPVEAGAAMAKDPLQPVGGGSLHRVFGGPAAVALWASTHKPAIEEADGVLWINPGSATLPSEGEPKSFARLQIENGTARAEIVRIGPA
ncbi:MAG: phosphodiesterase, family protein [Caulobacteraceae bacterium]|nr:phosphodiesterase, family protein [Caulobacteraceae bacterium]